MRALRFTAPGTIALVDAEPPAAGAGEALVAPRHVGLCGTDLELLAGTLPYFAEGVAAFPVQPGHEVAGVVVESPDERLPAGTEVLIDPVVGCGACEACASGFPTRCVDRGELGLRRGVAGGACELVAVPRANLHALPAGVSTREAVLVEPGVTVLNAVERLGEVAERRALVVGAGTLGLIAAQLLVRRGAAVDVVVLDDARAQLVERLGARPVRRVEAARYAAVVEAAGAPAALRDALAAVAPGGQVAVVGVQPGRVDDFDANALVLKDAVMYGVLNGPGRYDRLLAEIAAGRLDANALIDSEHELADAQAALDRMRAPERVAPKVMLHIGSG